MAYTTIIFEATDAWYFDVCAFKINLCSEELALTYRNYNGGYTMNGIRLNSNQIKRIKRIASPRIFEKFRDEKWKDGRKQEFILDGINWKIQLMSDDGLPMLKMESDMHIYSPPPALAELINYAIEIGKPKNIDLKLF